ncbi:MAG: winged helix-turn-helix transcriptional regulator [Rhodobacter sp.]|uniref:MarR family winged helix-turn-helix transcriptional regulator n=1 Tax=Pararhodobacter sp. TaxID=2127056 RepID=UPI001E0E19A3|nr:MarR family winged helix-turn-helix transcriptional regulator [Pararhodobacter sp.]MCB1344783.1 winged helix-turn-helix transcriptional regulator [Paracoccaceae bacterium]MCC0072657.1 winged helix-turn-helix transcriptional regulator [Rhodobacter sp.]HPD93217.1 MarR family winged helix-turn-helix transcriptional regulator [Pararhodobacter sp.]
MIFHESGEPQSDESPSRFLSDYLPFLLAMASTTASAGFHAQVRAHGLRVPEWRVLACLHDCDGLMVTRLAAQALSEQSAMTRVVERMEERGLLERRNDPRDRRRVRVYLTPEGRALVQDLAHQAKVNEAQMMTALTPEQSRALKSLLVTFLAAQPDNILRSDDL